MTTFFTKKQKIKMKERKKKKREALKGKGDDDEGSLPPPTSEQKEISSKQSEPRTITLPEGLSGKEARKFRKDARRKFRSDGADASLLKFVEAAQKDDDSDFKSTKKKKRKRDFPRINDILEQQQDDIEAEKQRVERQKVENALPDTYKAKYVALDCEMVGIGTEGKISALARVSLVDWYGIPVMDRFVQVPSRVIDFRTHVSGVRPKDINQRSAMDVNECRKTVASILRGKILVGHALKNDLQALLLQHPKDDIRDTAKYRPFQRVTGSKWRPRKLRDLVKEHLKKDIQVEGEAHDSIEDASATMDLFKLVREEWEKEIESAQKRSKKRKK